METLERQALGLVLPKGVFEWFDVAGSQGDESLVRITLEEKNIPPIPEQYKGRTAVPKGFTEITIADFPIRGRETLITFKRRYWQMEGLDGYLKRDIHLSFPGTQAGTGIC
jgi:hypothetical protein